MESKMEGMKLEEAAPCLDVEKGVIPPGSVCIVTGASRGIGREIALALAAAGQCKVVLNDVHEECKEAEALVERIKTLGGEAICCHGSVCCPEDVQKLVQCTVDKWGHIDVLVNNAGIMSNAPFMEMTPEQWHKVIDIDLNGCFYMSQAVLKKMCEQKKGRIINITSVNGVGPNVNKANYMAAKAGIIGLTKSIATEAAPCGILCNAVAPGYIDTAMAPTENEQIQKEVKANVPLGRIGCPSEVAGLVRYLALDPSAAYITGHTIYIDGGLLMM